jgi:pimeloyl-ACP methyl ester carboxylesterase
MDPRVKPGDGGFGRDGFGNRSGVPQHEHRENPTFAMTEIVLDGRAIETQWWGPSARAAPTLVLLHEGLGCIKLWRDVPRALAEETGCGVLAYSRFGYGASAPCPLPRPMSYMHDEAEKILPRVLDAFEIERCVLVGHSDGGSIAAIYAGSTQDFRVRGMALIAPHFFVEDSNIAAIEAIRDEYETGGLRARLARYHDNVDTAFWGWNGAWLDPKFRAFDLTDELTHIRVPMLLIQSTDDPYGTIAQLDFAARACMCPCDIVLIPDARHSPHLEAPIPTRAAIVAFTRHLLFTHEALPRPAI